MADWQHQFLQHIDDIDRDSWNQLAGTQYPFLRHEFLQALEASWSVCERSGWLPRHFLLRDRQGLAALMPLYLKSHSWGEYVFDWSWAEAYQRHGLAYYPKLLTAIPFTPCEGPRLALRPDLEPAQIYDEVSRRVQEHARSLSISSWHLLFPDAPAVAALDQLPLLKRQGVQFRWQNPAGLTNFAEYLETFASRKRKNVRKEREKVMKQGFRFHWREGRDIDVESLDHFYVFYQATYLKRGQRGYLTRDFFLRLLAEMPEQLLLIEAELGSKVVAGAFFLKNDSTLFGRYWGCLEEFDHLHFETCYYQGIDYCLATGLRYFDAGAQGEHKLLRGFEPRLTSSYHWLANSRFGEAIADFLNAETPQVRGYLEEAQLALPFRRD